MSFIFMAIAVWFAVWEGLMEPFLPNHIFGQEDFYQLAFGLICGILAYYLTVSVKHISVEEQAEKINKARGYSTFILSFGLSWFFLYAMMTNYDVFIEPYADFLYEHAQGNSIFFNPENKFTRIGYVVWFIGLIVLPFLVSMIKTLIIIVISLYAMEELFHKQFKIGSQSNLIKNLPSEWIIIFHFVVAGLIFLLQD